MQNTMTPLQRVRFDFRVWIVEALANFRFQPVGNQFEITEPSTGAQWLATPDENGRFTFTLTREMD